MTLNRLTIAIKTCFHRSALIPEQQLQPGETLGFLSFPSQRNRGTIPAGEAHYTSMLARRCRLVLNRNDLAVVISSKVVTSTRDNTEGSRRGRATRQGQGSPSHILDPQGQIFCRSYRNIAEVEAVGCHLNNRFRGFLCCHTEGVGYTTNRQRRIGCC